MVDPSVTRSLKERIKDAALIGARNAGRIAWVLLGIYLPGKAIVDLSEAKNSRTIHNGVEQGLEDIERTKIFLQGGPRIIIDEEYVDKDEPGIAARALGHFSHDNGTSPAKAIIGETIKNLYKFETSEKEIARLEEAKHSLDALGATRQKIDTDPRPEIMGGGLWLGAEVIVRLRRRGR